MKCVLNRSSYCMWRAHMDRMNALINKTVSIYMRTKMYLYFYQLLCCYVKVMVNTAKKRKLCISSLNPDLLLEGRQAPTENVTVLGACVHAVQQERFG